MSKYFWNRLQTYFHILFTIIWLYLYFRETFSVLVAMYHCLKLFFYGLRKVCSIHTDNWTFFLFLGAKRRLSCSCCYGPLFDVMFFLILGAKRRLSCSRSCCYGLLFDDIDVIFFFLFFRDQEKIVLFLLLWTIVWHYFFLFLGAKRRLSCSSSTTSTMFMVWPTV